MKKLTKVFSLVMVAALLLTCLAGCGTPNNATPENNSNEGNVAPVEVITIRCATSTNPTSMPATAAIERFCKEVTEKSNGHLKVEFYPNGTLGGDADTNKSVMDGTLEMGLVSLSNISGYTKLLDCVQTPFMINNYKIMDTVYRSKELRTLMDAAGEAANLKILGIYEYGIRHIANVIRPIEKMEDLKGLKIRAVTSDMIVQCMSAIGANATPLAYKEVYSALQNKTIDGEEINFTSVWAERHYEVIKYFTEIGLWPYPALLIVNPTFWKGLSAEDQALITECAEKALDYNMQTAAEYEKTAIDGMTKAGVQVTKIEDITPFQKATQSIADGIKASDPRVKAFIDMVQGLN